MKFPIAIVTAIMAIAVSNSYQLNTDASMSNIKPKQYLNVYANIRLIVENNGAELSKRCDDDCYSDCASGCDNEIEGPGFEISCSIACLDICGCL